MIKSCRAYYHKKDVDRHTNTIIVIIFTPLQNKNMKIFQEIHTKFCKSSVHAEYCQTSNIRLTCHKKKWCEFSETNMLESHLPSSVWQSSLNCCSMSRNTADFTHHRSSSTCYLQRFWWSLGVWWQLSQKNQLSKLITIAMWKEMKSYRKSYRGNKVNKIKTKIKT